MSVLYYCAPVYKLNKYGRIMMWHIYGNDDHIYTEHGIIDGAIQKDTVKVVCKGGKTCEEQATQEMRTAKIKKLRTGYIHNIADLGNPAASNKVYVSSFKAYKYENLVNGEDLPMDYPCICQEKVEGVRMCCWRDDEGVIQYMSKSNIKWNFLDHLDEDLHRIFDLFDEKTILDGELYRPDLRQEQLNSIVGSRVNRDKKIDTLQYHIFDIVEDNVPYEDRWAKIEMIFESGEYNFVMQIDHAWADSVDDVLDYYKKSVETRLSDYGIPGEGIMVRRLANDHPKKSKEYKKSLYIHSRSDSALKIKDEMDEDAEIVDIDEGKGRHAGAAIFILQGENGQTFRATGKFTKERKTEIFDNKEEYIGRIATYKFLERNGYGNVIYPTVTAIRVD